MRELVCISYSGIADRIQLLLAGYELAKSLGVEFSFLWAPTGHCNGLFNDILTLNDQPEEECGIRVWEDGMHHHNAPLLDGSNEEWSTVCHMVRTIHRNCECPILRLVGYPKHYNPDWFRDGKFLDFSPGVKEAASSIDCNVGCHVRVGDLAHKCPDLIRWYEALEPYDNESIFLASDSEWCRVNFRRAYGDRLVEYEYKTLDRNSPQGVFDAAVELCALRKCSDLVLSGYSGFSRLASKKWLPVSEGIVSQTNQ